MPRVLIPIDLPDDFRIEHIVAVFDRLDGHPIRKHLMPAGPIRHVDEAAARPTSAVERKPSLEDRVAALERKIAALEPVGVE